MVIDFHTHVFPDKIAKKTVSYLQETAQIPAYTDGTLNGLSASMEAGGIDCSVILPVITLDKQFDSITRFAHAVNEQYHNVTAGCLPKFVSFGGIHPDSPDYKNQIRILAEYGLKGIKLHPDYQQTKFNDIRYKRIVEEAASRDLTIVVHAGIDVGYPSPVHCTPVMAAEVIHDVQPEKMVLAHYGGWKMWDEAEAMLAGEPVYLDTSYSRGFIRDEQFMRILNKHGSSRIVFATDSPWSEQKENREWIEGMPMTAGQKEQILYENARKLLGI